MYKYQYRCPCAACVVWCVRGLLYCMEYMEDNLEEWLGEELEGYGEEDYLVFDCPGETLG